MCDARDRKFFFSFLSLFLCVCLLTRFQFPFLHIYLFILAGPEGQDERVQEQNHRNLGYIKGSLLTAKGQLMLKKAQKLQETGEKLLGVGETLKALKPVKTNEVHYSPAPAYGAPAPSY